MKYAEVTKLSHAPKILAHVMFADFEISNSFTDDLNNKLNLISNLNKNHPNYNESFTKSNSIADCIETNTNDTKVFSLILGRTNKDLITYSYLVYALDKLKSMCINQNISDIVICTNGLESLEKHIGIPIYIKGKNDMYSKLKTLTIESKIANAIEYEFYNTDINITCYKGEKYD